MSKGFKITTVAIILGFAILHWGYWKLDAWTKEGPDAELEIMTNELLRQNGFENGVENGVEIPSQEFVDEESVG